jgi:hypothetical protein
LGGSIQAQWLVGGSYPFRQQIKPRQLPRSRAVRRQGTTQGVDGAPVLQQQRRRHGRITSIGINGRPLLSGVQKDFRERAIFEPVDPGCVTDAAMLKVDKLVLASCGRRRLVDLVTSVSVYSTVNRKSPSPSPSGPKACRRTGPRRTQEEIFNPCQGALPRAGRHSFRARKVRKIRKVPSIMTTTPFLTFLAFLALVPGKE